MCQKIVSTMRPLLSIKSNCYPHYVLFLWGTQINRSVGRFIVQKCRIERVFISHTRYAGKFSKEEENMGAKVKTKYVVGPDVDLDSEVVLLSDGTRLTNKLAAKMARNAIKQVRGRPSLTAVAIESPQLKVRVPVKLKKAIEKEAKRRGETTSTIVRKVLQERFLQNH